MGERCGLRRHKPHRPLGLRLDIQHGLDVGAHHLTQHRQQRLRVVRRQALAEGAIGGVEVEDAEGTLRVTPGTEAPTTQRLEPLLYGLRIKALSEELKALLPELLSRGARGDLRGRLRAIGRCHEAGT